MVCLSALFASLIKSPLPALKARQWQNANSSEDRFVGLGRIRHCRGRGFDSRLAFFKKSWCVFLTDEAKEEGR